MIKRLLVGRTYYTDFMLCYEDFYEDRDHSNDILEFVVLGKTEKTIIIADAKNRNDKRYCALFVYPEAEEFIYDGKTISTWDCEEISYA